MYHKQFRNGINSAILIWLLNMFCLYFAGRFSGNGYVYWGAGVISATAVVAITYLPNHDLKDLGLYPKYLKQDGIVMCCILVIELLIGVCMFRMSWGYAIRSWLYCIFWIALQEELVYRGFIQSHLFSPRINRKVPRHISPIRCRSDHGMVCLRSNCVLRFSYTFCIVG